VNKKTNHNSIIFLTTLSVYLGLVLAGGATPTVLAQAALTRDFDIKNEIVFEDDLDKKPDDGEINFPVILAQLVEQISFEIAIGKISHPIQTEFYVEIESKLFPKDGEISVGSNLFNQNLSRIIQTTFSDKLHPKALKLADYEENFKKSKIRIEADGKSLTLKVSFSKLNSEQFAKFLNDKFSNSVVFANTLLLKQIYESTKATSENNQVFIVTRLPRASLDALLAEKDAQ
jgi:desulfoferrodoxin (superoxide reductase-like protein)